MTEVRIRKYRTGDVAKLSLREDMAAQFELLGHRIHDGPKWVIEIDGEPKGIGGIAFDESTDSYDLWALADNRLKPRHWVSIYNKTVEIIRARKEAFPQRRVWVCAGAAAHVGFVRRLGFVPSSQEGVFYV